MLESAWFMNVNGSYADFYRCEATTENNVNAVLFLSTMIIRFAYESAGTAVLKTFALC